VGAVGRVQLIMGSTKGNRAAAPSATPVDAVELELLTALCELTIVVAQAGQRLNPPLTIPPSLKPFLRFTHKLPSPGQRAVRKVLDADADWRMRVAAVASEALVGKSGVLFVNRPDGWAESFAHLVEERRLLADSVGLDKTMRNLERRLQASEDRVTALTAELAKVRKDAEERTATMRVELLAATAAVSVERSGRLAAEESVADSIAQRDLAVADMRKAVREHSDASGHLKLASAEIAALTKRVGELAARQPVAADVREPLGNILATLDAARGELVRLHLSLSAQPPSIGGVVPARPTPSKGQRLAAQQELNPSLRHPIPLPGGLLASDPMAAIHLIKERTATVFVDGYNLAKTVWPELQTGSSELRNRLLKLLDRVASVERRPLTVVFDGVGAAASPGSGARREATTRRETTRSQVHVVFSPASKEADVVITELVANMRADQAVIVVSSDRRVQRLVESMGANVISSQQFVAAFS
jgi:predicted RNA-binding protein with PIN domain